MFGIESFLSVNFCCSSEIGVKFRKFKFSDKFLKEFNSKGKRFFHSSHFNHLLFGFRLVVQSKKSRIQEILRDPDIHDIKLYLPIWSLSFRA